MEVFHSSRSETDEGVVKKKVLPEPRSGPGSMAQDAIH